MGGTVARPLLAAALIVRDESGALPGCLASLAGLVDEVHVHDTGSADGTPALAARLGAVVTRGPWTGDFAAARNRGLAACRADWVVILDADERLRADAAGLRGLLATTAADALRVEVLNLNDEGTYSTPSVRLFRPAAARYAGRVHEQVVARAGALRVQEAARALVCVEHHGYETAEVRATKCVRNAVLAQTALDELVAQGAAADPARVARTLLDLGRSFAGTDRKQDAVDALEALREMFPGTPEWTEATDALARLLLGAGMDEAVLTLSEQLRAAGAEQSYCDWLAAQAFAQLGEVERAWRLLQGVRDVVDTAGRRYDPAALRELTALVGQLRGR